MAVGTPSPPGYRGHPTRPYLTRVERGNPVKVHGVFRCRGKPTVRKAEFRGGNRTPKKQMPAAEKRRENGELHVRSFNRSFPHNWPDTGPRARL